MVLSLIFVIVYVLGCCFAERRIKNAETFEEIYVDVERFLKSPEASVLANTPKGYNAFKHINDAVGITSLKMNEIDFQKKIKETAEKSGCEIDTRTDDLELKILELFNTTENDWPKSIVLYTHGFLSNIQQFEKLGTALGDLGNKLNVNLITIGIDWSYYAAEGSALSYFKTRYCVGPVGQAVAESLQNIIKHDSQISTIALGHSLGGHVAGYIGKHSNHQLNYIWALDSAGPLFQRKKPATRLNSTDALIVENLHTSALWGLRKPFLDRDLYAGNLFKQKGCSSFLLDFFQICSHSKSIEYAVTTIENVLVEEKKTAWMYMCQHFEAEPAKCKIYDENNVYRLGEYLIHVMRSKGNQMYLKSIRKSGLFKDKPQNNKDSIFFSKRKIPSFFMRFKEAFN